MVQINLSQIIPRIERQHRIIEELRADAPRRIAGEAIASRLGVSVRTIERDIASLCDAGVPVQVKRGPGGGYTIDARRGTAAVDLTPGECAALIASLVAVGPRVSATAQSALAKLIESLSGGRDS